MKPKGKGTGSIRRARWDAMFVAWLHCEHFCPVHGIWKHTIAPEFACHMRIFMSCAECIEVPTGYGKPLMRQPI